MVHNENNEVQPTQPGDDQGQQEAAQPAESANIATPTSDQPTPEPQPEPAKPDPETIPYADRDKSLWEYMKWQIDQQKAKDQAVRDDPLLRLAMVNFVRGLWELVQDVAGALAVKRGYTDPFATDEAAEQILWQGLEFLGQVVIDSDSEEYRMNVKPHQLTALHAGHWFHVSEYADGGRLWYKPDELFDIAEANNVREPAE